MKIKNTEIKISQNRNLVAYGGPAGYIHYSEAKRHGLRTGDVIEIEVNGEVTHSYEVGSYIDWRNDINRTFKGFELN